MSATERYSRQVLLWGEERQQQLEAATILVAGVGGLGAAVAELLARAGIGKLYLADDGKIATSGIFMPTIFACFSTVLTSHLSIFVDGLVRTTAPVMRFAIHLDINSDINDPPKPITPESMTKA